MLIITGPDNVGKTTIIKHFKKYRKDITFHTYHFSAVHTDYEKSKQYTIKLFNEVFKIHDYIRENFEKSDVILDRSHLDEYVYGYLRNKNLNIDYLIKDIEEKNNLDKVCLIILLADVDTLIKRDDGLSPFKLTKKNIEIERFKNLFSITKIKNKAIINVENKSIDTILNEINNYYMRVER